MLSSFFPTLGMLKNSYDLEVLSENLKSMGLAQTKKVDNLILESIGIAEAKKDNEFTDKKSNMEAFLAARKNALNKTEKDPFLYEKILNGSYLFNYLGLTNGEIKFFEREKPKTYRKAVKKIFQKEVESHFYEKLGGESSNQKVLETVEMLLPVAAKIKATSQANKLMEKEIEERGLKIELEKNKEKNRKHYKAEWKKRKKEHIAKVKKLMTEIKDWF